MKKIENESNKGIKSFISNILDIIFFVWIIFSFGVIFIFPMLVPVANIKFQLFYLPLLIAHIFFVVGLYALIKKFKIGIFFIGAGIIISGCAIFSTYPELISNLIKSDFMLDMLPNFIGMLMMFAMAMGVAINEIKNKRNSVLVSATVIDFNKSSENYCSPILSYNYAGKDYILNKPIYIERKSYIIGDELTIGIKKDDPTSESSYFVYKNKTLLLIIIFIGSGLLSILSYIFDWA